MPPAPHCFKRKKQVVRHFLRTTGGLNDSPALAIFFIKCSNWEVGMLGWIGGSPIYRVVDGKGRVQIKSFLVSKAG